jgi:NAD(P)-dependent dehydrogenase (short-subunit alcohol dehydrogenase family)
MKYDFTNKIVLVTGGTGALGRAVSGAFIACDAKVVSSYVIDREIEDLKKREQICIRIKQGRCNKGRGSREISFKRH